LAAETDSKNRFFELHGFAASASPA
jgi:hypothetical protein